MHSAKGLKHEKGKCSFHEHNNSPHSFIRERTNMTWVVEEATPFVECVKSTITYYDSEAKTNEKGYRPFISCKAAYYVPKYGGALEDGCYLWEFQVKLAACTGSWVGLTTELTAFRGLRHDEGVVREGVVSVFILLQLAEDIRVYFYHNGEARGPVCHITERNTVPIYPMCSVYDGGQVTLVERSVCPIEFRPPKELPLSITGSWAMTEATLKELDIATLPNNPPYISVERCRGSIDPDPKGYETYYFNFKDGMVGVTGDYLVSKDSVKSLWVSGPIFVDEQSESEKKWNRWYENFFKEVVKIEYTARTLTMTSKRGVHFKFVRTKERTDLDTKNVFK